MAAMKKLLFAVPMVLLAAIVMAFVFVDSLAKRAIERGGTYALGVETRLDSADIGVFSGEFGLAELHVANPPGFAKPDFLELDRAKLEFPLSALASERVVVPLLELDGIVLDLERNQNGTNYGTILTNLERFESGEPPAGETEEEAPGKIFVLERLVVRNVRADLDLLPIGGEATKVSVSIPEIVVEDLDQSGMTASEIFALVVKTLLTAAVRAGGGVIPEDLLRDLGGRLGELEAVAVELSGQIEEALEKGSEDLRKAAEDAVKGAGKKLEDILKGE
jgi:hypothetical protein